jgi:hypothetical protein
MPLIMINTGFSAYKQQNAALFCSFTKGDHNI